MNTPLTNKNIAAWNDQPFDNYHDIIVSFDYARFNEQIAPTGGFAVVFFDSIVDMPREGGAEYALGYSPSSDPYYCSLNGFNGLKAGYVGVGFDSYGFFAAKTNVVDGLTANFYPNSFAVRGGVEQNYSLIYNSLNLSYVAPQLNNFTLDEKVDSIHTVKYRSVRVILQKASTEIKIQIKPDTNTSTDYVTVGIIKLPFARRTTLKVALTNTTVDPSTRMVIKNFNVAGLPGTLSNRTLSGCSQVLSLKGYANSTVLPVNNEFVATVVGKNIVNYTTDTVKYQLKNTIFSSGGLNIIGQKENFILAKITGDNNLIVYKYLGEKFARVATIAMPCQCEPLAADIDPTSNLLAVCTSALSGSIYFYNLITNSESPTIFDTWYLYQTITSLHVVSGLGLGISCSLYADNLLVGNNNQLVHAFQKNTAGEWGFLQNLTDLVTGTTKFGKNVAVFGRDAIVAAPYSPKINFANPGQGEVYHYYLSPSTNRWNFIMGLGNFYKINTPAGNFGTSISLKENTLVVGSPGEMYGYNSMQEYEVNPNTGRVYIFNKTSGGLFTQTTVWYPHDDIRQQNTYFGQGVNIYKDNIFILAPFAEKNNNSCIFISDIKCSQIVPSLHLPVPDCAVALMDGSGFVIDQGTSTYLLSYDCVEGLLPVYYTFTVAFSGFGYGTFDAPGKHYTTGLYTVTSFPVLSGTTVNFTVSAEIGSQLIGIFGSTCGGIGTSTCSSFITGDTTVYVALSAPNPYPTLNIAFSGDGYGTVNLSGYGINVSNTSLYQVLSYSFLQGATVAFTVSANPGSQFVSITGSTCSGPGISACTVNMNIDQTVTVTLTAI